jgi:putative flippase GtrA
VWYLYSSIAAFCLAFFVSFALQKFWTFSDKSLDKMHHQFAKYALVAGLGIAVNTIFMYLLVDLLNLWYILAQIFTGVLVAAMNFFAYKIFIFK